MKKILFSEPEISGDELQFVADAIARGKLAGDGYYTLGCQDKIRAVTGAAECLLTHSGTAALEMAAILLYLKSGDEVIMPSFTFASTANAVVLRGATPVFVDVRSDTLNIDEQKVADALTKQTRAVFAVHYAGVPAEMDALHAAVAGRDIPIIEDAAQAFGSRYRGRPAGSLGDMAALSFHETKNVISGEGGALVMRDTNFARRAEIIREKGTNRREFLRGMTDKYTWVDLGSSYLPSELVAAFLYGQLCAREMIARQRMELWNFYWNAFSDLSDVNVRLPVVPKHCEHNAHLFYLIAPDTRERNRMIQALAADGIVAPFHYVPLHSSPAGRRYGREAGALTHTNDFSARLLRLPLFSKLGDDRYRIAERVRYHARH